MLEQNRWLRAHQHRGLDVYERIALYLGSPTASGCVEWQGGLSASGYGQIRAGGKNHVVTRLIWSRANGDILQGQIVCHTCDNPRCCAINHLFLGTHEDNAQDKVKKGRHPRGEAHTAKLTDDQVRAILRDVRSHRVVAKDYQVAPSLIWAIRHRKAWAHIDPLQEPAWRPMRSRYDGASKSRQP